MISADTICDVLDELVGRTTPFGSTEVDKKVEKNLETLINISDWCIDRLTEAAIYRHRAEYSMRSIGKTAMSELNYIKTQIEEVEDNE